ncbi:bacterioferritin [Abyssogena phaseoliformis symbiont OG214]|uniref:ferritin-like domain-containing protein n=1 Tax=Abyssogena phaseoliformis symbiont TaxID=596095 RepID=UPI0019153A20|nr:Bacterioferritin [Candidatus Ruthia sp. Apha_13_S6]BBB22843.1 bacterioferritin [Abyssogena phaseoliformis symbiont OG214]
MQGNTRVINQLQDLLKGELAVRDQYFTHSRRSLSKLFERLNHEMEEETDHADQIIKRLLFLEVAPDLSIQEGLNIGRDVTSCIENDLKLKYKVVSDLKSSIKLCEQEQDFITRTMLTSQLEATEQDHTY